MHWAGPDARAEAGAYGTLRSKHRLPSALPALAFEAKWAVLAVQKCTEFYYVF